MNNFILYGLVNNPNFTLNNAYKNKEPLLGFDDIYAFPEEINLGIPSKYDPQCWNDIIPPKKNGYTRIISYNVHNFHKTCFHQNEINKNPDYVFEVIKK